MRENHYVMFKHKNGYWYYYIYRYGKRVRRTTGEKKKMAAMAVIEERLENNDLINDRKHSPYVKFEDYVSDFWNYDTCPIIQSKLKRGGRYSRKHAINCNGAVHKYMIPYFKTKALEEITASMIENWMFKLQSVLSNKTINDHLATMRTMLDQAISDGLIKYNVAKNVKPLIHTSQRRGCYTVEQIQQIFKEDWPNHFSYVACYLAAHTGMRMGEVRALKPEQIHKDYIEVNAAWSDADGRKCTKSGYGRIVPINEKIYQMLKEITFNEDYIFIGSTGKPKAMGVFTEALQKRMDEIGIDWKALNLGFHSFRHFFNSRLVASGLKGEEVRAVIGHESEDMTMHYLHLTAQDMENIKKIQNSIGA